MVVPVGVLPAYPCEQPDVAGIGPEQRQVPAHDKIGPQIAALRQPRGDSPELRGRQTASRWDQTAHIVSDRLLPLRADTPAAPQPGAAIACLLDARAARSGYGERFFRPAANGWYPARGQRLTMPVLADVGGPFPGR